MCTPAEFINVLSRHCSSNLLTLCLTIQVHRSEGGLAEQPSNPLCDTWEGVRSYKLWRQCGTKDIHADFAGRTRNEDVGYVIRQTRPNPEQSAQSDTMPGTLQGPHGITSADNCRGTCGRGRARGGGEIQVLEVRSPRSTSASPSSSKVVTGVNHEPLPIDTHTHARCSSPHLSTHPFQNVQRELLHACRKNWRTLCRMSRRGQEGVLVFPLPSMRGAELSLKSSTA